jgi:hypothetical protein
MIINIILLLIKQLIIYIEFNEDNLNNFLKEFKLSSYNKKFYRFNNWLDVFNFYKDI